MKYTIEYLPDEDIIAVNLSGRLNFQKAEQFSREAVKYARENSCNNFLIDHTETVIEKGVYRLHTTGAELQQFGFQSNDNIAVIVKKPAKKIDMPVADGSNSRWSNVKYFNSNNQKEAMEWLIKESTN